MSNTIELGTWVQLYEARNALNKVLGLGTTSGVSKSMANHDPLSLVARMRELFQGAGTDQADVARALIHLDIALQTIGKAPTVVGREKATR